MDVKLRDHITLKNVIFMTLVIKDDNKFYPELFLEEHWEMNRNGNNVMKKKNMLKKIGYRKRIE